MPPRNLDDQNRKKHILKECQFLSAVSKNLQRNDLSTNEILFRAICFSMIIIGEASHHLTIDFKNSHPEIEWHEIYAMRNVLVHSYDAIVYDAIWQTITEDIPLLHNQLNRIAREEPQ